VIRCARARRDLGRLAPAEVAARHGFADQSHLHRDVVRFAGETPAELAEARRPTARTAIGADPRE
jgi:AraC-like DNA-binding protein